MNNTLKICCSGSSAHHLFELLSELCFPHQTSGIWLKMVLPGERELLLTFCVSAVTASYRSRARIHGSKVQCTKQDHNA